LIRDRRKKKRRREGGEIGLLYPRDVADSRREIE
jgi:hypothetical protein